MAPIAAALMVGVGWVGAMQILGLLVLLCLPAAFLLKGNSLQAAPAGHKVVGTREAIRTALRHPSYLMLGAGFFVCGFHVAFLATHLPGVIAIVRPADAMGRLVAGDDRPVQHRRQRRHGLGRRALAHEVAAVAGLCGARPRGARVPARAQDRPVVLMFAAVMGLTFLSTVPPTAGLVAKFFGPANMATLFGIVMLTHQVGGFLGAWLGGKVFEATGAYDWVWYIDIVLAVGAALIHLPIRESELPPASQAAAA